LAALIGIPYSYHAPDSYVRTNITGTLNILQAAREYNVERVCILPPAKCMAQRAMFPLTKAMLCKARALFRQQNRADKMVESFHRSFDLPVVTVRPFNTFGPRQSARAVIPRSLPINRRSVLRLGNLTQHAT